MRDKREIAVLAGLAKSLQTAADLLRQEQTPVWYLVVVKEVGEPIVHEFPTIDECLTAMRDLQEEQLRQPDVPIYVLVFEGRRWSLTKTPAPGLCYGNEFVPLKSLRAPANENGAVKSLIDII